MFLKSILHLSLGNDVTSSVKNIVIQSSQNLFSAAGQLSGRLQDFAGENPIL